MASLNTGFVLKATAVIIAIVAFVGLSDWWFDDIDACLDAGGM
jgi:hypothetical protein